MDATTLLIAIIVVGALAYAAAAQFRGLVGTTVAPAETQNTEQTATTSNEQ